jgi:hypothetical protein
VRLGREVAEVLVDPVGGERALDVLVPPLVLSHLGQPGLGDVPVVVHVVVVEDHRGRDHRQKPPDVGVAPALQVELGVVLEVEHALTGRLGRIALRLDERARGG